MLMCSPSGWAIGGLGKLGIARMQRRRYISGRSSSLGGRIAVVLRPSDLAGPGVSLFLRLRPIAESVKPVSVTLHSAPRVAGIVAEPAYPWNALRTMLRASRRPGCTVCGS